LPERDVVLVVGVEQGSCEASLTFIGLFSNISLTAMAEGQPKPIPDPQRASHEGGNGSPGFQRNIQEQPTLPQKSALNRAVERTRNLYERNRWFFLPFSEAREGSPMLPSRPSTVIFSPLSHDHLLEETKKPEITQTPQEAWKNSPKVPNPHSEKKKPMTPEDAAMLDRAMRWFFSLPEKEREEVFDSVMRGARERMSEGERFFEQLRLEEKIRSMLPDQDPDVAEVFRRTFGPPDHLTPAPEKLQRMFDLPSADEPPSDIKR
jgi:hypothetical protein